MAAVTDDGVSPSRAIAIVISLGLVAHQIFRKYETYNIAVHVALLFGPPTLVIALALPSQWSIIHAALVLYSTYLATLATSVVLYRLSPLHPLARYPGPIGCRISKLYMGVVCIPGYQHKYIKALHERYGDVVRIGPNELSIRDASLVNPLMGSSGLPKGPHFIGRMLTDSALPMVGIQDTDVHLRRRKNWQRGMGPAAIKEYEQFIARRARQLLSRLEEQKGEVVIGNWINYLTYDFMSDMAFGGGSELLEAGHDEGNVWALLDEGMFIATFFGHMPWLGVYIGKIPAATGNLNILLNRCIECTVARVKKGSEKKDLFHYLNQEDLPDAPPVPIQQLVDDGVLAIIAGADTTSSAMTTIVYCLLTHPDVYERLQAEVDKYYPSGEDALSTKHHREMPYLNAVINEVLRVYPPVPGGSQRQVPPNGQGVLVGNLYIPPGTSFWCHIYSTQHDPRNFTDPSSFWPERWLLAAGDPSLPPSDPAARGFDRETLVHNEAGFLPFSHGPMNCVGKTLAMQEMRMVVCALLQRFRIRASESFDSGKFEKDYRDYFTAPRPEVPVLLEVRG
ncbi:high nitrogen upregulated cytochrome P450 monooxygenase 2 [Lentinus brumalis]|uniref:High nitrogen upregulated cytochrome P450 monooxygenase 2 n=1 Tax=Lentinus brumalis TaxID=2498619 RepID=A0A371CN68_9APHY|nr:high nitrogen upregulated cytochrome P450 monooxygenase 2 [Polyporus brumalis]